MFLFDGRQRGMLRHTRTVPLTCTTEPCALRCADELRQGQYAELWRSEDIVKVFQPT